ncbi:MAG: PspC domain-containing protein [Chloroflexi bacterium]|nr:PspC domain-containing protein [Chloroflexota bacterium]
MTQPTDQPLEAVPTPAPAVQRSALTRSRHDRVFTGLAGGLAIHFGIDPVLVRLALVLLTIFSSGVGLLLYVIGSVIVPLEPATAGEPTVPGDRSDLGSAAAMVFGILLIGAGVVALLSTVGDRARRGVRWGGGGRYQVAGQTRQSSTAVIHSARPRRSSLRATSAWGQRGSA